MSFLIASGHVEVEAKTDAAKSKITALIGAMGALGPAAGVAGAALASAGVGLAAFGAAAGKQVADLKKAADAQSKYQDAVAKSGKGSQEAVKAEQAYQQTLAKMPKATKEATAAFAALKDSYDDWSDSLAGDTMPVFTKSFQLFQALLPKTTGLVQGTSKELDRLITMIAGGVASPGFDRFMDNLTRFSTATLHTMTDGVLQLSRSLGGFASGGGFDGFIDTAQRVGPLLGETLANLAHALLNIVSAGGDLGVSMLTVANALASVVNALPPEAVSLLLQLYTAFKLVKIGAAGVVAMRAGLVTFTATLMGMQTAAAGATGASAALRAAFATLSTGARAALIGSGIGALVIAVSSLASMGESAGPDVDRLSTSLGKLAETGKVSGEAARAYGQDLSGLAESLRTLARPSNAEGVQQWMTQLIGMDSTPVKNAKKDLDGVDEALSKLVQGGKSELAAAAFDKTAAYMEKAGMSSGELREQLDGYRGALEAQAFEQQLAAQAMGLFGQQAIDTSNKLAEQKASADGLRQSLVALNDVNRGALDAQSAFEASLDAATAAARQYGDVWQASGGKLSLTTDKGRSAYQALSDLAAKTNEATAAARESGASWSTVNSTFSRGRQELIASARQMGLSREAAKALADQILKTPDKTAKLKMNDEDAVADLDRFIAKVKASPSSKSVRLDAITAAGEKKLESLGYKVTHMKDGSVTVTSKTGQALGGIGAVQRARDKLSDKSITITTVRRTVLQTIASGPKTTADLLRQQAKNAGGATGGRFGGRSFRTHYDTGGRVYGPGTGTSDDVPAPWLSNGEWVIKAASVAKYGDRFLAAINDGTFKPGPHFAKGGKLSEKQKAAIEAEKQRQKEGKSALKSDVTFTTGGALAGYKYTETVHDLGMPESVSSLVSSINSYLSNIKKAFTGSTEKRLVSQLTSSGKALLNNQKKLEAVNKSLDSAKSNLDDLKSKFDSLKTSVSSSLVSFGNVTKIGKYGTSADTLIQQLQSDTSRTTEFSQQLEALRKKGLNATAIGDIAAAGVTGGGLATAQSLLNATPDQIKKINELQAQLQKSADAAGTTAATAMYGAGIAAAQGLVAGLTAQQTAIENAMKKIALSMEAAIKKALGIKSPSKVMEPVGDYAFQGVERGWMKRASAGNTMITGGPALRASRSMVTTATPAPAAAPVIYLSPTFNMASVPSPAERRAFAEAMAGDISDALRRRDRQRA